MSIKKTTLAVAVLASIAAVATPATAASSVTYPAYNCVGDTTIPITVELTILGDKTVQVTPSSIDMGAHAPDATTDELEWVVKSRYRTASGTRRDVVSRGDVSFTDFSASTPLENRKNSWVVKALSGIRVLEMGLTTDAHTPSEAAHVIVSLEEDGCAPEAD